MYNLHVRSNSGNIKSNRALITIQVVVQTGIGSNKEAAKFVGKLIAKRALEAGITNVVFDRGGYIFHGRVKELAEGAREGGLNF